jgi:hypothetical protein
LRNTRRDLELGSMLRMRLFGAITNGVLLGIARDSAVSNALGEVIELA